MEVPCRGTQDWRILIGTTSRGQGRHREVGSEGSRRQNCEPTDRNAIEGRGPGRASPRWRSPEFTDYGKWRGCAGKVHALIRGDLRDGRSRNYGSRTADQGERPGHSTGPYGISAAPWRVTVMVAVQKSAEAIVGSPSWELKGRTSLNREEPSVARKPRGTRPGKWRSARSDEAGLGCQRSSGGRSPSEIFGSHLLLNGEPPCADPHAGWCGGREGKPSRLPD